MTRFLSLILGFILSFAALAQPYPSRPVKIVVPFGPGGTADTLGRLVAGKLSEQLKEGFVIENKGGAGGVVGSELVAKSAPDGSCQEARPTIRSRTSRISRSSAGRRPCSPSTLGFRRRR